MKLLRLAAVAAVLAGSALGAVAQQAPPATPDEHPGTVIFSRSVDQNGSAPVAPAPAVKEAAAEVSDAQRQAITFLSYDLDVHLQPREHALSVRARLSVRNDSSEPLRQLPLQISSSLHWTGVKVAGAKAVFSQHLVKSAIDHTGALQEGVVSLPQPLGARQSVALDVTYEGDAALSTVRLEQIGTPPDVAEASDWDQVSEEFVGLRGLGNVAWYPLTSVPVALGDGARFFTETAAERQRQSQAMVTMTVTEEFYGQGANQAPNLAVLDGTTSMITPSSLPTSDGVPGIVSCTLPPTRLGFASPSLFLLTRTSAEGNGVDVFARTEDVANAQFYISAAAMVAPLIHLWLGAEPKGTLNIVDLPEANDAPFEDGAVLFTNVRSAEPARLAEILVHSLTHVYFRSPYPWLQEGVASFMGSLWAEKSLGRDAAIQQLDNNRGALSLAEPDAVQSQVPTKDEQALRLAKDPVYYRTKATYVFWMLRDLAGEGALGRALREYQPGSDTAGTGFEQVLERESGKDLKWFFRDWVNHDRGLPDLSIAGVYPNKTGAPGAYLVAVEVLNSGGAETEVPVSVSSGTTTVTERLRVPARSRVSHRFLLQGQPAQVAVNDGTVPEVEASVHRQTLSVPASDAQTTP